MRVCVRARARAIARRRTKLDGMERRWQTAGRRDARYRTVRGIIVLFEQQRRDERAGWSTRMCTARKPTPTRSNTQARCKYECLDAGDDD